MANRRDPEIEDVRERFCGRPRKNAIPLSESHPDLSLEWCYRRNCGWSPSDFTHGSSVRSWWTCLRCKRDYKAKINQRASHSKTACPYCAGQKVCTGNSLAHKYPNVAKEWHPVKNGKLRPHHVTSGTNRKVWWLCASKHSWQTAIAGRTKRGRGCPKCAGKEPSKENNLKKLFPEIAAQWHNDRNKGLSPGQVTPGSGELVWWLCTKGPDHEWQARIHERTRGRGCPFCAGKRPSLTNSLATLRPDIACHWDNKRNEPLTAQDVTRMSGKVVWWLCQSGHSWQARVKARSNGQGVCRKCASKNEIKNRKDHLRKPSKKN